MYLGKVFAFCIAAVFFFAAGVYFQSKHSEENITRELASVRQGRSNASSKYDSKVTGALKNCLQEKVKNNSLDYTKVVVDGRSWSILSIDCSGDRAKALYEAVAPYSSEQYVRYRDGRRGVGRFFGRLFPPSQCVRVIRTSRGSELNVYNCSIRMDIDHELIQRLKI
ncbi:MAG: hypothetical protein M9962_08920 [Oligoflexia bacterium]|nr:hypothetical protein [Oligoflexia bacterium]